MPRESAAKLAAPAGLSTSPVGGAAASPAVSVPGSQQVPRRRTAESNLLVSRRHGGSTRPRFTLKPTYFVGSTSQRLFSKFLLVSGESLGHQINPSDENPGFNGFTPGLVVFAQPTRTASPGQGTRHDPTSGYHHTMARRTFRHHLPLTPSASAPVAQVPDPVDEPTAIPLIGPNLFHAPVFFFQRLQDDFGPVTSLDIGRRAANFQHPAWRIHPHMPVSDIYLLPRLIATRPPVSLVLALGLSKLVALA